MSEHVLSRDNLLPFSRRYVLERYDFMVMSWAEMTNLQKYLRISLMTKICGEILHLRDCTLSDFLFKKFNLNLWRETENLREQGLVPISMMGHDGVSQEDQRFGHLYAIKHAYFYPSVCFEDCGYIGREYDKSYAITSHPYPILAHYIPLGSKKLHPHQCADIFVVNLFEEPDEGDSGYVVYEMDVLFPPELYEAGVTIEKLWEYTEGYEDWIVNSVVMGLSRQIEENTKLVPMRDTLKGWLER